MTTYYYDACKTSHMTSCYQKGFEAGQKSSKIDIEDELRKDALKEAMINLIKESAKAEENFIFEKLQDYMDLSEPSHPKWTSNVRLRMIENSEAYNNGFEAGQKSSEISNIERLKENIDGLRETNRDIKSGVFKALDYEDGYKKGIQAETQRILGLINEWLNEYCTHPEYLENEGCPLCMEELKQSLTNHCQETKQGLSSNDGTTIMGRKSLLSHMNKTPDASNGSNSHPEKPHIKDPNVGISGSDNNQICECGHEYNSHREKGKYRDMQERGGKCIEIIEHGNECPCKKFQPKTEYLPPLNLYLFPKTEMKK